MSQAGQDAWTSRWPPEILAAWAAAAVVSVLAPLNTDSGWAMVIGRGVLQGQRLYADLLETNPPAFFWLMLVPAGASRHLTVSDARLVGAFIAILIAISTVLALEILRRPPRPSRPLRLLLIGAFYAGLIVPFTAQYGQREQSATILGFPYALLAARTAAGERGLPRLLRVIVSVVGGAGFAIKPFFLAAWAAIELAVLACTRLRSRVRLEAVIVVGVQALFVGLVYLITPDYFTRILPLARATYEAYGRSRFEIASEPQVWVLTLLAISALAAGTLGSARPRRYATVFAAATLGWLFEYVVQGKGWYYQFIPARPSRR